jgi:hypothetical protein
MVAEQGEFKISAKEDLSRESGAAITRWFGRKIGYVLKKEQYG